MASTHHHAPWRKSILVPFWVIQLLIQLLLIGLLSLAVSFVVRYENDDDYNYTFTYNKAAKIVVPIWLAVLVICLILTITEIVLLAKHKLKPLTFLIMNGIKSLVWTVLFILDIISVVDQSVSRTATAISIFLEAILLLSYWIPLLYGSILYHRFRTNKKSYSAVSQPATAFPPINPNTTDTEYQGAFPLPTPLYNPPTTSSYTPYTPLPPSKTPTPPNFPPQFQGLVEELPLATNTNTNTNTNTPRGERRLSYNHQRDTRFDSFRNERGSPVSNSGGEYPDFGTVAVGSPTTPEIRVQLHDADVFEMERGGRRVSN